MNEFCEKEFGNLCLDIRQKIIQSFVIMNDKSTTSVPQWVDGEPYNPRHAPQPSAEAGKLADFLEEYAVDLAETKEGHDTFRQAAAALRARDEDKERMEKVLHRIAYRPQDDRPWRTIEEMQEAAREALRAARTATKKGAS